MKKWFLLASLSFGLGLGGLLHWTSAASLDAAADEPITVVTHVDVMPNFTGPGRELLKQFVTDSRQDPGAVRVEVFEEIGRPNHSTVVEIWKTRQMYEEHRATDHTRVYRTRLQPMLGSPFDERLHHSPQ